MQQIRMTLKHRKKIYGKFFKKHIKCNRKFNVSRGFQWKVLREADKWEIIMGKIGRKQ